MGDFNDSRRFTADLHRVSHEHSCPNLEDAAELQCLCLKCGITFSAKSLEVSFNSLAETWKFITKCRQPAFTYSSIFSIVSSGVPMMQGDLSTTSSGNF